MSLAGLAKLHAAFIKPSDPPAPSARQKKNNDYLAAQLKLAAQKDDLEGFKQLAKLTSDPELFLSFNTLHNGCCVAELACQSSKSEGMVQALMDNGLKARQSFKVSGAGFPRSTESVFTLSLKLARWETAAMIALTLPSSDASMGLLALRYAAEGAGRFPNQGENDLIAAGNLIRHFSSNAMKADPTAPLGAEHPLMALASPHMGALDALIKLGVDVNAQDNKGRSALHIAAAQASEDAASLLLAHGANIKAIDSEGRTPLEALCLAAIAPQSSTSFYSMATRSGAETRLARALLTAGADVNEASFLDNPDIRARLGLDTEWNPAPASRRVLNRPLAQPLLIKPRAGSGAP